MSVRFPCPHSNQWRLLMPSLIANMAPADMTDYLANAFPVLARATAETVACGAPDAHYERAIRDKRR